MQYKISVIMPVYNTEVYLARAIESVLNQTLKDFELIIVNDGSTDNSKSIINSYSDYDTRIKVINKENSGLGYARNSGLEYASGEYIFFIDSDDCIEKCTLEEIYTIANETKSDIIVFNMKKILEDTNEVTQKEILKLTNETISIKEIGINKYFKQYFFPYVHGHEACNKLYRTSFLKLSKVVFDSNDYICAEDLMFNLKLIPFVDKITSINKSYYNYYQRANSIMNSGYRERLIERFTNLINEYYSYVQENGTISINNELSVLYLNLIDSAFYNERIKLGNNINTYYKVLNCTDSIFFRKSMKNIAISKECKNLLIAYGMKNYTVYIIKLFSLACYFNIKLASIIWYFYMKIVRFK